MNTAFQVNDKLWVGGSALKLPIGAESYAINFQFGCQTTETGTANIYMHTCIHTYIYIHTSGNNTFPFSVGKGLFRTQLADGIMGMAMNDDTLPYQLQKQGVTKTKIFALCFRIGGGIFTIG